MIDPSVLRAKPEWVAENLARRGFSVDVEKLHRLESERKQWQTQAQALQNQRNSLSKAIGLAKSRKEDPAALLAEVAALSERLHESEQQAARSVNAQEAYWATLPNLLLEEVPLGLTEEENIEVKQWGNPRSPENCRDHMELTAKGNWIDSASAAKMSGARFVVLSGQVARLHRALGQFMLDTHTQNHGYQEKAVPYLVDEKALFRTAQLPHLQEDLFHIVGERKLALIPTAEVSLTNLVQDSILTVSDLPLKYTALSPCFRSEAGSYGKDTKGMFRQHQFDKVELVQIVEPEDSARALEEIVQHAESILQALGLAYRIVLKCGGDTGFSAAKTYDLEVWLPSQGRYREISSCSNITCFQARRLQARYKDTPQAKARLLHTLNGSGLAVGRTLIAIIENFQDPAGDVIIPEVLKTYMGGLSKLSF